ncbi:hypothetical protein M5689_011441 [Euphorbia peplus]|nr:hypothetical protein M5689_011441 [Euphorbia peplus]
MMTKITLTENEEEVVNLNPAHAHKLFEPPKPSLIDKVLSNKPLNLTAMANAFTMGWKIKDFQVKELGNELFVCEFETRKEQDRILHEGPCHFDKKLVILQELFDDEIPLEIRMKECDFWIRVINLPLNLIQVVVS